MLGTLAVAERLWGGGVFIAPSQRRAQLLSHSADDAIAQIFLFCFFTVGLSSRVFPLSHRFVFVSRCVSPIHAVISRCCLNILLHSSTPLCHHSFIAENIFVTLINEGSSAST